MEEHCKGQRGMTSNCEGGQGPSWTVEPLVMMILKKMFLNEIGVNEEEGKTHSSNNLFLMVKYQIMREANV
jgi:hypothetical protein